MPVIFGTAGHIDHGKTTLVRALTGQDTDRLPEEKARGISIDLGFAQMTLPNGQRAAFVDVPGHERFVRNMVAGVHGMDAVLMIVAADEGIMPQTREHLAILKLLGVERGLTVISKADLVDDEMLALVTEVVEDTVQTTFLGARPTAVVDAVSGHGMDDLRRRLNDLAQDASRREATGAARLPIDRVFTIKGFGTVVTGTLVAGRVQLEDTMQLQPGNLSVRVRRLEVHGESVVRADAGQRVAVNLAGVERDEVVRGQVLAPPGVVQATDLMTVEVEVLDSSDAIATGTRLHVHLGTAEALARIYFFEGDHAEPGGRLFAELRLETPMAASRSDRFIIRSYSPMVTIGGGKVIEIGQHHRRREPGLWDRMTRLSQGDDRGLIVKELDDSPAPLSAGELSKRLGVPVEEIIALISEDPEVAAGHDHDYWSKSQAGRWRERVAEAVRQHQAAHPLQPGMDRESIRSKYAENWSPRAFQWMLEADVPWVLDREWVSLATPSPGPEWLDRVERVYQALDNAGIQAPNLSQLMQGLSLQDTVGYDVLLYLMERGRVVRMDETVYISDRAAEEGTRMVRDAIRTEGALTTAQLKEALGINRRSAVIFLEWLDRQHVTRRQGETRIVL